MKIIFILIFLVACGGSDSTQVAFKAKYSGVLKGKDCFSSVPFERKVLFDLFVDEFVEGKKVLLINQSNLFNQKEEWQGAMISNSSFIATEPNLDSRFSITVTDINDNYAKINVIDHCVSFRCCTSSSGIIYKLDDKK